MAKKSRNPLILISGEGHSGTSMFLRFLYLLGFDNGGDIRGPIEFLKGLNITPDIRWPEIIKHGGGFCADLKKWVKNNNWDPQHFFYMANTMDITVNKRLYADPGVGVRINPRVNFGMRVSDYKRLSDEEKTELVKDKYYRRLGKAIYGAFELGIPVTVIHYQRFCRDIDYACQMLDPILHLKDLDMEDIRRVHREFVDLEKVKPWKRMSDKVTQ